MTTDSNKLRPTTRDPHYFMLDEVIDHRDESRVKRGGEDLAIPQCRAIGGSKKDTAAVPG